MWKFSGLFRCEKFQAYLGVKISGLKFSGVKFFNPPYLAQFQPNLHVKILAWSHVKISGLKQVWFTCENRCDRFGTGRYSARALRRTTSCFSFRYNKQLIAQLVRRHDDLFNPENACLPRATWIFWVEKSFRGRHEFSEQIIIMCPSKLGNKCKIVNWHSRPDSKFWPWAKQPRHGNLRSLACKAYPDTGQDAQRWL